MIMIEKAQWSAFRSSGLLWWVNRTLHLFGWAIVVELDSSGEVAAAYPARCRYRGFGEEQESDGFKALTGHIRESIPNMEKDVVL